MDHPKPWLRYVEAWNINDQTLGLDGLSVRNSTSEELGTVDGLVVDAASGRPYYVAVYAGGWFSSKRFLVPIGEIHLNPARDAFEVSLSKEQIARFPGFDTDAFDKLSEVEIKRINERMGEAFEPGVQYPANEPYSALWTRASYRMPEWWTSPQDPTDKEVAAERAADAVDKSRGVLGDIDPLPTARDRRFAGTEITEDEDPTAMSGGSQHDRARHAGSRDVTEGTSGGLGPETGGTRNYRQGSGATGGDIGNRPE